MNVGEIECEIDRPGNGKNLFFSVYIHRSAGVDQRLDHNREFQTQYGPELIVVSPG